jgi:anthranilate/para-aminobenzoate synthase component I
MTGLVEAKILEDLPLEVRELPADLETPVSVYLKLAGKGPSFLLESVTGGEQVARYSFIGVHPRRAFVFRGTQMTVETPLGGTSQPEYNEESVVSRLPAIHLLAFIPAGLSYFAGRR